MVIGTLTCVGFAVIVSYITGNQKIQETSPKFIIPLLRKFYWTKEELIALEEDFDSLEEAELNTSPSTLSGKLKSTPSILTLSKTINSKPSVIAPKERMLRISKQQKTMKKKYCILLYITTILYYL
ncbi:UNVERIFIED_CONTAM: hypothetical protein RMT77_013820 [Armadillidium vulgare]